MLLPLVVGIVTGRNYLTPLYFEDLGARGGWQLRTTLDSSVAAKRDDLQLLNLAHGITVAGHWASFWLHRTLWGELS